MTRYYAWIPATRGGRVPDGLTRATVKTGHVVQRRTGLLHFCDVVFVDWSVRHASGVPRMVAEYKCGGYTANIDREGSGVAIATADMVVNGVYCKKCQGLADAVRLGVPAGTPAIYYALVDGLIKIGSSVNVGARILGLKGELLAAEPAYMAGMERGRHHQFRHLRDHGLEWYRPGADLLAHIESLRAKAVS